MNFTVKFNPTMKCTINKHPILLKKFASWIILSIKSRTKRAINISPVHFIKMSTDKHHWLCWHASIIRISALSKRFDRETGQVSSRKSVIGKHPIDSHLLPRKKKQNWLSNENFHFPVPFNLSPARNCLIKGRNRGGDFLGSMPFVPRDETFEKLFADVTSPFDRKIYPNRIRPPPPPHIGDSRTVSFSSVFLWNGWEKGREKAVSMRWFEYDRRIFKQRGEYLNIGLRVDGKSESIIVASVFE